MAAVLVLVFGFLVGETAALVVAPVALLTFVLLWFGIPAYLRRQLSIERAEG